MDGAGPKGEPGRVVAVLVGGRMGWAREIAPGLVAVTDARLNDELAAHGAVLIDLDGGS